MPTDTRQAILDAAFAFKQAGGIVIVVAPRASSVLNGFDLAERIATGGFFINASNSTAAETLLQLNYLKKLLCAGSCVDPGDRYANLPALGYSTFANWEVVEGIVNLLGPGLYDFLPGNGLYVELSGQSHAVIRTIDTFDLVAGQTYMLSFKAAGNQQSESASQSISASLRVGDTKLFEQTVFPAWNDEFQTYNFSFTAPYNATVRLYFEQNYAGTAIPGTMLDDVRFTSNGVTLLADNFDDENMTYIPPACGGSDALAEVADPPGLTVSSESTGGAPVALPFTEAYVYSITAVTNEGETAETLCSVSPVPPSADEEGDINRVIWPPVPLPPVTSPPTTTTRIVSWRLWRSLGEDISGWSGPTAPRYLLAELPANQTTYIDTEHIAEFTARHEPSVTAPTVNTTAIALGGLGYGYAPCCYYSVSGDVSGENLIPVMASNAEQGVTLSGSTSAGSTSNPPLEGDLYFVADGDPLTFTTLPSTTPTPFPAGEVWIQCDFAEPKLISSYLLAFTSEYASSPNAWRLKGSNDGSSWTLLDERSGETVWVDGVEKSFSAAATEGYSSFRLEILEVNGAVEESTFCILSTWQLVSGGRVFEFTNNCPECLTEVPGAQVADATGLADIETGGLPPPPQIFTAYKCVTCGTGFANLGTILFSSTSPTGTLLSFDLTVAATAAVYELTTLDADHAPRDWEFQGSANNATWTTLDTQTDKTWFDGETKRYAVAVPAGYRYYRVLVNEVAVPANDPLLTQVVLYGAGPASACATATSPDGQPTADAAATAAATALLRCVPIFSATRSYTATCPYNQYGPSVTRSKTRTSFNSQAEADALAQAAAEAEANGDLDCELSNNTQKITINDSDGSSIAPASPYPSVAFVEGLTGVVAEVVVTLNGLSHGSPDDIKIVLMSPTGETCELMRNCGGVTSVGGGLQSGGVSPGIDVEFDDDAASSLPDSGGFAAGSFKPSQYGVAASLPVPAPQSPYGTQLSDFDGIDPNGAWSLWVGDDLGLFPGAIFGGWTLDITTV